MDAKSREQTAPDQRISEAAKAPRCGALTSHAHLNSILVIQPGPLGSVVQALPAVAALRQAHPLAEITWLIDPQFAPLLRGNSDVNHVHFLPSRQAPALGAPTGLLSWLKQTRKMRPELALDFQESLRSALVAKASGARAICGMSSAHFAGKIFYDRVTRVDGRSHAVERYLRLAESVGGAIGRELRWFIPSGDPLPRFQLQPPFVLLHPFARGDSSLCNAAIEELCRALRPLRIVIAGHARRRVPLIENAVDLTDQTSLLQVVWLVRAARFVIAVQGGLIHLAAAMTPNLLSIHAWSDPRATGPYNPDAWVWKQGRLLSVRELNQAQLPKRGRRFGPKDVSLVAELIRSRVSAGPAPA